jgi:hypothetical protein
VGANGFRANRRNFYGASVLTVKRGAYETDEKCEASRAGGGSRHGSQDTWKNRTQSGSLRPLFNSRLVALA